MQRPLMIGLAAVLLAGVAGAADEAPLRGFTRDGSASQERWEKKLREIPSADALRETMRRLSARPHHVGSPYGKDNAEWILARFKEWGWDAGIETFEVLFPTPKERVLEMVEPTRFAAQARRAGARRSIRPRLRRPSSSRPTTPTRSTAT